MLEPQPTICRVWRNANICRSVLPSGTSAIVTEPWYHGAWAIASVHKAGRPNRHNQRSVCTLIHGVYPAAHRKPPLVAKSLEQGGLRYSWTERH
jgi:hypothetical protein